MEINYLVALAAGLIPMVMGFVWYHPKTFGNAWMNSVGITEAEVNSGNMPLIMGLSYLFSCMLSLFMLTITVHQFMTQGLFATMPEFSQPGSDVHNFFQNFMANYGDRHRSFGHGAVHGGMAGFFFVFPIIAIKALFERKSWKYILINAGYWFITLMLIGGVMCQFA